jgi:hypothetical protein
VVGSGGGSRGGGGGGGEHGQAGVRIITIDRNKGNR